MASEVPLAERFGRNVRTRRRQLGLSQEKLAELLNSNVQYISEIERGGGNPTLRSVEKLARALECPEGELLR
jgi:transcriptional regulator with XRE-family HTH domain